MGAERPIELLRALAVLGEPPSDEHGRIAEAVGLGPVPDGARYADIFVLQLYPYASVYLGPEGMLGGEARDRVAGFWRALGQTPPTEPDHLSALLGLYATLCERTSALEGPQAALVDRSRRVLLHEHLASWAPFFLARVAKVEDPFYAAWAQLLGRILAAETREASRSPDLGVHLREAPTLPDPRTAGGRTFLRGLLAPVRSGMILTRTDLARVSRELGLGLRVGERRYVLEHLLGQEPTGVLDALAAEASARAAGHARWAADLGPVARFWEDRALSAAMLLRELASEGAQALAPGERVAP